MKNLVSEGNVVQHAHTDVVVSGQVLIVGAWLLVAMKDLAANEQGSYLKRGVAELPKATGVVFALGDKLYWNGTALNKTAEDNHYAGICNQAQLTGDVLAHCDINAYTPDTVNLTP